MCDAKFRINEHVGRVASSGNVALIATFIIIIITSNMTDDATSISAQT